MKKMIIILCLLAVLSFMYAEIDLGINEILPGTIYYGTSAKIFPNVKIHNYGDEAVNEFDVNVVIFDYIGDVYDFTKNFTNIVLNAGEETFITMDDLWIVDDPDLIYAITATVIVDDDMNPDNDVLSASCNIIQLDYTEEAYAIKYVLYDDKTFGSLELETGNYTQIADVGLTFSNRARGADFAEGVMYGIYSYNSIREFHLMQPDGVNILLGEITSDNFITNESISSFTYDYDNHKFYFSTSTTGVLEPRLYTLNPFTLEAEFIGQINNLQFMSIEYAEGILYGVEVQQRKLWQIDMETGVGTEIGSFGLGWLMLDQCLSYDRSSGIMYATFFLETSGGIFCTVNLETGNATQIQAYGYDDNMKFFAINATSPPSAENDIISFTIPEQIGETIINTINHTVQIDVPDGTNITILIPTIGISDLATIDPASGTPQDFTDMVEYTVTAENGDEQIWIVTVTLLVSSDDNLTPSVTKLTGNFPNPFNPTTTISFSVKEAGHVSINIYNMKGQLVKTLMNEHLEAAYHSAVWNGKDNSNKMVSSGIYFYKMRSGNYTSTKKMILMK